MENNFFVMWRRMNSSLWPEVSGPFSEEDAERRAETLRSGKNDAMVFQPDSF